jgi:antitoxin Phd
MRTIAAKDAKNGFGCMLDTVQRDPVTIAKYGRAVAGNLSIEEYQRLEALEDAWWAARAQEAVDEGEWLGPEESERLIRQLPDAED